MEVNCRYNPRYGFFSLATGGDISPDEDFPVSSLQKLPETADGADKDKKAAKSGKGSKKKRKKKKKSALSESGKDVMKLINSPKLKVIEYKD